MCLSQPKAAAAAAAATAQQQQHQQQQQQFAASVTVSGGDGGDSTGGGAPVVDAAQQQHQHQAPQQAAVAASPPMVTIQAPPQQQPQTQQQPQPTPQQQPQMEAPPPIQQQHQPPPSQHHQQQQQQLEHQRQQLILERQAFHLDQLRYLEQRAKHDAQSRLVASGQLPASLPPGFEVTGPPQPQPQVAMVAPSALAAVAAATAAQAQQQQHQHQQQQQHMVQLQQPPQPQFAAPVTVSGGGGGDSTGGGAPVVDAAQQQQHQPPPSQHHQQQQQQVQSNLDMTPFGAGQRIMQPPPSQQQQLPPAPPSHYPPHFVYGPPPQQPPYYAPPAQAPPQQQQLGRGAPPPEVVVAATMSPALSRERLSAAAEKILSQIAELRASELVSLELESHWTDVVRSHRMSVETEKPAPVLSSAQQRQLADAQQKAAASGGGRHYVHFAQERQRLDKETQALKERLDSEMRLLCEKMLEIRELMGEDKAASPSLSEEALEAIANAQIHPEVESYPSEKMLEVHEEKAELANGEKAEESPEVESYSREKMLEARELIGKDKSASPSLFEEAPKAIANAQIHPARYPFKNKILGNSVGQNPQNRNASSPSTNFRFFVSMWIEAKKQGWHVGDRCWALWKKDKLYYSAEILSISSDGQRFTVLYIDYDDTRAELNLADLIHEEETEFVNEEANENVAKPSFNAYIADRVGGWAMYGQHWRGCGIVSRIGDEGAPGYKCFISTPLIYVAAQRWVGGRLEAVELHLSGAAAGERKFRIGDRVRFLARGIVIKNLWP